MDIEKLQKVQERMRAVLNEEKPLVGFEDLAKATGLWEVAESGSLDEPCVIRVGACEFVEEDETSMSLDGSDEEKLKKEVEGELREIVAALEGDADNGEEEQSIELSPAQTLRVKKAILN